ncbi:HPr kinase/phosphorylase [Sneathiella sp.]|uniref:HPr kinase/phosphorylase n=1 Tax=Sneathiella sp. TaxID=1964365 RepID=UPI002607CB08|nr:HPr kinase/phosphatase C-terminal domain-containing protein [Sneathiella sp.]MDF2367386.1 HPr kinase/phosphatase C-terminal domain-containing protein [Sneathiella sp.]
MIRCHASSVEIEGRGVLLRGPSGSGKSDLALRLVDGGGTLISDDYTEIHLRDGGVYLKAPAEIAGKIEVRGLGLMPLPAVSDIPLALVFDLMPYNQIDRAPAADVAVFDGIEIPLRALDPFMASASAIVRLALRQNPLLTGYE